MENTTSLFVPSNQKVVFGLVTNLQRLPDAGIQRLAVLAGGERLVGGEGFEAERQHEA